jgi:hypothetical protein
MGQKPRQPPQNVPDSLPERDPGTDVLPDDVRRTDRSRRMPPDSLPPAEDETSPDGGGAECHERASVRGARARLNCPGIFLFG